MKRVIGLVLFLVACGIGPTSPKPSYIAFRIDQSCAAVMASPQRIILSVDDSPIDTVQLNIGQDSPAYVVTPGLHTVSARALSVTGLTWRAPPQEVVPNGFYPFIMRC